MIIKVICTNNNTRLLLTTNNNQILVQITAGMVGLKGATRSSIYGAEKVYKRFLELIGKNKNGYTILIKGIGPSRNYLLRKLGLLKINKIKDITPFPHNGCRLPKSLRK